MYYTLIKHARRIPSIIINDKNVSFCSDSIYGCNTTLFTSERVTFHLHAVIITQNLVTQ